MSGVLFTQGKIVTMHPTVLTHLLPFLSGHFSIGYVELASIELVEKALALTGTIVLGIPISVELTEAERNKQAATNTPAAHPPPPHASLPAPPAIG